MSTLLGIVLALLPAYLVRFHLFGLPTTLLEILLLIFFAATLIRFERSDLQKLRSLGRINWAIGLFVLAGLIETLVSPDQRAALGQLKAFIIEPILLFYGARLSIKSEADLNHALRWLSAGASLVSLFGLVQYFTFIHLSFQFWGTGDEVRRITSVFEHPNQLALYLAPLFVLFLTLRLKNHRLLHHSWIEVARLAVMLIALILTFSRGAWLAVSIISLIVFLRSFPAKKILPYLALAAALILIFRPVQQRLALGLSDPSSSLHFDLMKIGAAKIISSPLVGNGLAGFPATLAQFGYHGQSQNYPHDIFLNFWLELGLLGLIAFAYIIMLVAEQIKKHPSAIKFAAGMFLLTVIVHGLVDSPYFKNDLSVLFWFVVSIAWL